MIAAVLLGIGGVVLGAFLILDHHLQHVKWHYWIAPIMLILTGITLWQVTAMYMTTVGRKELRNRPPTRD